MAYFTNTIYYVDHTPTDRLWTCMTRRHFPFGKSPNSISKTRKAETSFKMASYGPGDSEEAVTVYTTDTIVDHPGAEIVYKGLLVSGERYWTLRHVIEAAKARAKEIGANAIVGLKITREGERFFFIGTAVRFSE